MRKKVSLILLIFWIIQFVFIPGAVIPGYCLEALSDLEQQDKADPNLWDFGTVKPEAVLKHEFVFTNETSENLEINSIHTSCGCTASQAGKKMLMPQENTTITVTFNAHGYSGPVRQFVYVNTSGAEQSIIKFTIKANVVKE